MKYKVGDKVRVRKDLKVNRKYGKLTFWDEMEYLKGKTFVISKIKEDEYAYFLENEHYYVSEEMIERKEDIIEYKGKKYEIKEEHKKTLYSGVYVPLWDTDLVLSLTEHKEEILDEAEKRYLRNVIKYVIEPTHNKVKSIEKRHNLDWYYIRINYGIDDYSCLPEFTDKRMYKGMEIDKEYSLNELGLEE